MFRNTVDKLKGYALGTGANPLYQNIADYGTAAALGVAGQQGANWLMGGADPNPLVSGALMSPLVAGGIRGARGYAARNQLGGISQEMADKMLASKHSSFGISGSRNPYELQAANIAGAGLLGGIGASAYNTLAGGADIDNNISAGILAAAAPLTAYLMNRRAAKANQPIAID